MAGGGGVVAVAAGEDLAAELVEVAAEQQAGQAGGADKRRRVVGERVERRVERQRVLVVEQRQLVAALQVGRGRVGERAQVGLVDEDRRLALERVRLARGAARGREAEHVRLADALQREVVLERLQVERGRGRRVHGQQRRLLQTRDHRPLQRQHVGGRGRQLARRWRP